MKKLLLVGLLVLGLVLPLQAEEFGDVEVLGTLDVTGATTLSSMTTFPSLTASGILGTNASKQASIITALPNGTTATTQSQADNSTKVATTAYVDTGLSTKVKNDGTVNPTNLLSNGDFEFWSAGTSIAPDGWIHGGAGASIAREGTIIKLGTYSVKITDTGTDAYAYQSFHGVKGINYWKGRKITCGCWVYATVANKVAISLVDGVSSTASNFHTGNSTWQWLSSTHTVSDTATNLELYLYINASNTSAYFDGVMCMEGESAFAFADKPVSLGNGRYGTFVANGATPVTVSNTNVAITDCIVISLNTVGGTVGVQPHVATITANTGFTVVCTALDTSTYNYCLIKQ